MSNQPNKFITRRETAAEIPKLGQNPSERKRVLNVLAQRRYRQRKKDQLRNLESKFASLAPLIEAQPNAQSSSHAEEIRNQVLIYRPDSCSLELPVTDSSEALCGTSLQSLISFEQSHLDGLAEPFDPNSTFLSDLLHLGPGSDEAMANQDPFSPSFAEFVTTNNSTTQVIAANELENVTTSMQGYTARSTSFPDSRHLPMYELTLLAGSMAIARLLKIDELIWNFGAISPFTDPKNALETYSDLPRHLQPTLAQRLIPHHPMLDILPWPETRTRLIEIFSAPEDLRPPSAAKETAQAMLDLLNDVDDGAEGLKVWGADPYDIKNWEVGQRVWKRWWWAFDGEAWKRSNEFRRLRGAESLGKVLGELA